LLTKDQINSVAGLSAREAAVVLGVGKSTVSESRRRLAAEKPQEAVSGSYYSQTPDGTIEVSTGLTGAPATAEQILIERGINPEKYNVSFGFSEWPGGEGEIKRSYRVKATPKTTKDVLPKLDADELREAIAGFSFVPRVSTGSELERRTFVVTPSDMQIGKTSYNGGTPETIERVMASFSKAETFAKEHEFAQIIIAELGDPLENFYSTSSQEQTNDLDLTGQIRTARRLLIEGVKMLAPYTPNLVYAAVPSNHGSVRKGFKAPAGDNHNDWGLEIQNQIQDAVRFNNSYDHVSFARPEKLQESLALTTVSGTTLGMVHGHQARGAEKLGEWWKGQTHGRQPVAKADILLAGHWHSFRVQHSGAAKWVMVSPASDPGSDWFTNITGEYSETGMLSFTTANGMWDDLRIL
jgi:hypothetical protein